LSFQSKPASRGNVKPLIAIHSESGGGKSLSALYLARGIVGPKGNIQVLDTEQGRGELYSDVLPGGYNVIPFPDPFSPARYIEAITYAEGLGAEIIVVDQGSSEWEGPGGVLDMAGENEAKGNKGLSVWKAPKMEHAKFIQKLQRSRCPIIVCLRSKYKSRQVKQNGRTEIVRDEFLTPIQDESFIFESTVHGYCTQDHAFHPTKISHPSLGRCLPNGEPITIKHGESIAKWCAAPGGKSSGMPSSFSEVAMLKNALWELTKKHHGGDKTRLFQYLIDEAIISDTETLDDYSTVERLNSLIAKVKAKLEAGGYQDGVAAGEKGTR
jgi:hypothetical protein